MLSDYSIILHRECTNRRGHATRNYGRSVESILFRVKINTRKGNKGFFFKIRSNRQGRSKRGLNFYLKGVDEINWAEEKF